MPIEFAPPQPNLQPFNVPPPQYTDPLQTLAEMGQLRTQNLQRQGMQQEVQQRQMQMDSNKALMDSMVQSGGDYNKFFSLAAQHPNILPNDLIAARQHYMQYQQEAANYDKTTRENTSAGIDQYRGLLANVKTPDDLAAANAQADQLKIHPNVPRLTQFSDPSHVTAFSNGLATNAQILAEAKEKAATEASAATTTETGLKNVALTKQQLISDARSAQQDPTTGTPTPAAWQAIVSNPKYKDLNLPQQPTKAYLDNLAESTIPEKDLPEYRIKTGQADAMRAWRSGDPTKIDQVVDNIAPQSDPMNATTKNLLHYIVNSGGTKEEFDKAVKDLYDHRKTIATETDPTVQKAKEDVARINAQNKQNLIFQGLGSVDQPSTMAQMVANYQVPLQTALARTPPAARSAVLDQVKAINPQFQEQYYQSFQNTENDATSGKLADSSKALNTMMGHLGVLNQAADALKNGDVQVLNRIANTIGVQFGKTPQTTYNTIVHRLGPEITKAYVAGGGTSGERGTNEEDFGLNLGRDQIKQNIGISAYLADSLIKANQEQYNRGTYGRGAQKLMSDEAEATRQRLLQQVPANLRQGPAGGGNGGNASLYIKVGNKRYLYKGSGAKNDLNNYTEVPNK